MAKDRPRRRFAIQLHQSARGVRSAPRDQFGIAVALCVAVDFLFPNLYGSGSRASNFISRAVCRSCAQFAPEEHRKPITRAVNSAAPGTIRPKALFQLLSGLAIIAIMVGFFFLWAALVKEVAILTQLSRVPVVIVLGVSLFGLAVALTGWVELLTEMDFDKLSDRWNDATLAADSAWNWCSAS